MSQESLSALVDGECSDAELDRLLAEMDRQPGLGQQWSRWHLSREAAEGTRVLDGQPCICAGVMAALEEPRRTGRVVDLAAFRRRVATLPWRPAVGLAAAASMGAAAMLFLAPQQHDAGFAAAGAGEGAGASVRVGNPLAGTISLPVGRSMGRLQAVSLTGDNNGTTFADEEYAALLRDYIASRNAAAAYGDGARYVRFDTSALAAEASR